MIAQGTDGLSRGLLMEGVVAGKDMLSYVDLVKTAMERCPSVSDWVHSWVGDTSLQPLTPEEWFGEGYGII